MFPFELIELLEIRLSSSLFHQDSSYLGQWKPSHYYNQCSVPSHLTQWGYCICPSWNIFFYLSFKMPLILGFFFPCQLILPSSLCWLFILSQLLIFGLSQGLFFRSLLFSPHSLSNFIQSNGFKYYLHFKNSQSQKFQEWIPGYLSTYLTFHLDVECASHM